MKKIFTIILVSTGLFFTASAQNRNDRYDNQNGYPVNQTDQNRNDRYNNQDRYPANQPDQNWNYGGQQQSRDYGYNDRRQCNRDYRRQAEYDRRNQQCDNRNVGYGNDGYGNTGYGTDGYGNDSYGNGRSNNPYERNRRMQEPEQGNQQKTKAFGKGLVVGGIAAILIGAILSHGN